MDKMIWRAKTDSHYYWARPEKFVLISLEKVKGNKWEAKIVNTKKRTEIKKHFKTPEEAMSFVYPEGETNELV
jgi:hypothetical protein